jgi:hypothetical protein
LVFELEALVEMQRVLKGSVSEEQVTKLINLVVEGFSESTRLKNNDRGKAEGTAQIV